MQLPQIHINGSDPDALFDSYMAALEKAQEALQALRMVDVNGRDYYQISATAGTTAREEHAQRCAKLESIVADLEAIATHIDESR